MLLSIIIPQYKEDDKTVKRLLSSIDYQLNVNWDEVQVIIVNDGSDVKLSEEMLKSFDNIKFLNYMQLPKNVGPGLCRQAGLDAARGEYVTFCDADDMYQNFGVLALYLDIIKEKHPDILRTSWIEEIKVDNSYKYLTHSHETTWMHGKCFRKEFLTENNIRFSDKLLYHEDSYFLSNAFEITTNVVDSQAVTYIWTFDENSITRKNSGAYSYESIPEFVRSIGYSIDWLNEKTPKKIPAKVVQLSLYIYYMIQTNPGWSNDIKIEIENELSRLIKRYEKEFNSLVVAEFSAIDLSERQKVANKPFIMTETFSNWIVRIINRYTNNDKVSE